MLRLDVRGVCVVSALSMLATLSSAGPIEPAMSPGRPQPAPYAGAVSLSLSVSPVVVPDTMAAENWSLSPSANQDISSAPSSLPAQVSYIRSYELSRPATPMAQSPLTPSLHVRSRMGEALELARSNVFELTLAAIVGGGSLWLCLKDSRAKRSPA